MSDRTAVIEIIGSGSFGTVAVLQDLDTGSFAAVKVLRTSHLDNDKVLARTADEVALLARLDAPNIVGLRPIRELDNHPIVPMEWVPGVNVEELLAMHPDGVETGIALTIFRQAVQGLSDAWNAIDPVTGRHLRIIHRDIKPGNLLLSLDGVVKIADFGIAQAEFEGRQSDTISVILGARGYLAPERLDGAPDHPLLDIYAMGLVLFHLLTGERLVLWLHEQDHKKSLEAGLAKLDRKVMPNAVREGIRTLIRNLVAYDPFARPNHQTVLAATDQLIAALPRRPDLPAFCDQWVLGAVERRVHVPPKAHHDWHEISFLETRSGNEPLTDTGVDLILDALLDSPNWFSKWIVVRKVIARDPTWSPRPFLDLLDRTDRPWWQVWRNRGKTEELLAILDVLIQKPTQAVKERAGVLLTHPDAAVQVRAETLLTQ